MPKIYKVAEVAYHTEEDAIAASDASPASPVYVCDTDAPECERCWVKVHPHADETPAETPHAIGLADA